jgi:hypothetical protein
MNKILSIVLIMMLICSSFFISATARLIEYDEVFSPITTSMTDETCPSDFQLVAYGGGIPLWEPYYLIEINNEGMGVYSILYPENKSTGNYTEIEQFQLNQVSLDQLWNMIINHGFFTLDSYYTAEDYFDDPNMTISGGTFANLHIQGDNDEHMVEARNIKIPDFDMIISTLNDLTPGDNDLFYNAQINLPPFTPSLPEGPTDGKYRSAHTYTTQALDIDGDQLFYQFDWGDETFSEWTGPFPSNSPMNISHKWLKQGNFSIRVKVKDDPNHDGDPSDGLESNWSSPLAVSLPKIRLPQFFWYLFIQRIAEILSPFSFFDQITVSEQSTRPFNGNEAPFPPTEVSIDEEACIITIKIRIRIYGEGASDTLASTMETAVENKLNKDKDGKPWKVKCHDGCDPRDPGCDVKIDVEIKNIGKSKPKTGEGYHDFYVAAKSTSLQLSNTLKPKRYTAFTLAVDLNKKDNIVDWPRPNDKTSSSKDKILHNGGTWGYLNADDSVDTWAHEFLHCMGLGDKYDEVWTDTDGDGYRSDDEVKPKPREGHKDDIMADATKWLQQWGIDKTLERAKIKCPCSCCPGAQDPLPPDNTISNPQNGESVGSAVLVIGHADDGPEGSGIAKLDYSLIWAMGNYDGSERIIDPPVEQLDYELGPINLDSFINPGDWITITTYAIDAADNVGEDSVTVTWVEEQEDTIPPVTEKTVGEPQWEGGYTIASFTPIQLVATDPEPGSGVNHIHYEVWQYGIMQGSEDVPGDFAEMTFGMYGVLGGVAEIHYYAVDNENNVETTHIQEHFILY